MPDSLPLAAPRGSPAEPASTLGVARLMRMAWEGRDLLPVWQALAARIAADPADAAALMDMATILLLTGHREQGLATQAAAIGLSPLYHRPHGRADALRVLAFVAAGDFLVNTPLDFLLEGSDIALHLLYVDDALALPPGLPEHDVAFLAIGESAARQGLLARLQGLVEASPRPVMNGAPGRIAALSRDGVAAMFAADLQVLAPQTVRVARTALLALRDGKCDLAALLPGADYPILLRPLDSQAGSGFGKLDGAAALGPYLAEQQEPAFFLSPFIDYRSADGLYRKLRIVFIQGEPFISHMAVSEHWMVHYLSAGMIESAARRADEAQLMETFETGFALRHRAAFACLQRRIGLDYFGIDCAELPDGRLLLFEADVAMIVHALDDAVLFPYKQPAMRRLFAGFRAGLERVAQRGAGVSPA